MTAIDVGARDVPLTGNAAAGLSGFLTSLGITGTRTRDSVEQTVERQLAARGLDAVVSELRWGHLTLTAGPQAARLLRFDIDALLDAVNAEHPGAVSDIRVSVARGGR